MRRSSFIAVLVAGLVACVAGSASAAPFDELKPQILEEIEALKKEIRELTVQRQCEYEYNELAADHIADADIVISLACGIGVQTMNEQFHDKLTVPGLNTSGLSQPTEQGVWEERCQACGDCVLALTGAGEPGSEAQVLVDGQVAGFDDRLQGLPLVLHVALDRFHKVGNQVIPPL